MSAQNIDDVASPLAALLGQLAAVVKRLDDEQYAVQGARGISGSIGGHVRHCLDHASALIAAAGSDRIDYDHRCRGTAVESCRAAALAEIQRVTHDLRLLAVHPVDRPLQLVAAVDCRGARLSAPSSVGRELAFVVSHTIHHLAVIAFLLRDLSIEVPSRFGYAPTTPAFAEAPAGTSRPKTTAA